MLDYFIRFVVRQNPKSRKRVGNHLNFDCYGTGESYR